MFQTKVVQKIKTHILCSVTFFPKNLAVYEMWKKKNIVERDWPQMTIWRMRIACRIPKATNTHTHTHTQHIILPFPHQQWLRERAPKCYVIRTSPVLLRISDQHPEHDWSTGYSPRQQLGVVLLTVQLFYRRYEMSQLWSASDVTLNVLGSPAIWDPDDVRISLDPLRPSRTQRLGHSLPAWNTGMEIGRMGGWEGEVCRIGLPCTTNGGTEIAWVTGRGRGKCSVTSEGWTKRNGTIDYPQLHLYLHQRHQTWLVWGELLLSLQ
jgi:hypothetical protein